MRELHVLTVQIQCIVLHACMLAADQAKLVYACCMHCTETLHVPQAAGEAVAAKHELQRAQLELQAVESAHAATLAHNGRLQAEMAAAGSESSEIEASLQQAHTRADTAESTLAQLRQEVQLLQEEVGQLQAGAEEVRCDSRWLGCMQSWKHPWARFVRFVAGRG